MEDAFKSPIKKLNKFFKKSRDSWKDRAKKSIKEIRGYKKRIQFLEMSKASLKDQIQKMKGKNKVLENSKKNNSGWS